jgi:adenylyltransferase/sulfurtransferase
MRNQPTPSRDRSPLAGDDWRAGSPLNTDKVESWEATPRELRRRLDLGEPIVLVDVREPWETEIVALPGSRHIPLNELRYRAYEEIDPEDEIVLYCHAGARSQEAAFMLWEFGYEHVRSLAGGIDRWAVEVDPSLPRY